MQGWNEARIEAVRAGWLSGSTAAEIAALPVFDGSGLTRDAIIGLAHRRGWKKTQATISALASVTNGLRRAVRRHKAKPLPFSPSAPQTSPAGSPGAPEPIPPPVLATTSEAFGKWTILTLPYRGRCKWPEGNAEDGATLFCGNGTDEAIVYCPYHARIAYTPGAAARRYHYRG